MVAAASPRRAFEAADVRGGRPEHFTGRRLAGRDRLRGLLLHSLLVGLLVRIGLRSLLVGLLLRLLRGLWRGLLLILLLRRRLVLLLILLRDLRGGRPVIVVIAATNQGNARRADARTGADAQQRAPREAPPRYAGPIVLLAHVALLSRSSIVERRQRPFVRRP